MKDYNSSHDKEDSSHNSSQSGGDFEQFGDDLRPRSGAEQVDIGRQRETGQFDGTGGDAVPLERDSETGQFGSDPFAVGNFGEFNSPYSTDDKDKEKYD